MEVRNLFVAILLLFTVVGNSTAESFNPAVPPKLLSPNGAYVVGIGGSLLRIRAESKTGGEYEIQTYFQYVGKYNYDMGFRENDLSAIGKFDSHNQRLMLRLVVIPPNSKIAYKYHHCGPIFSEPVQYRLEGVPDEDAGFVPDGWEAVRISRQCVVPETDWYKCRVVRCLEYSSAKEDSGNLHGIITLNESWARWISKIRVHDERSFRDDYEEATRLYGSKNSGSNAASRTQSYEERQKAFMDEWQKLIDDFVIDQF